jgi:ABC-2 type transport system ATP-binding protein
MIEVSQLVFDYPGTRALDNVSFSVAPQSVTALVGPNGAGKTTLLRSLAALDEPLSGIIRIDGIDVLADPRACHRRVGYLSDFFGLYEELTVRQCLTHAACANGIAGKKLAQAVELSAERLGISDRLAEKAGTLSRGLRQRLAIAQAIVHEPKVLLLDEPASGLDPEARHSLATLFLDLRDMGMTLFVSSHILAELEEYSDGMIILRNGRIVSQESVHSLHAARTTLRLGLINPLAELDKILADIEGVEDVRIDGTMASFAFVRDPDAQHGLLKELLDRGLPLCAFGEERHSMQQSYLATVKNSGERDAL